MRISNTSVNAMKPSSGGYDLFWDSHLQGFGVRVTQAGAKSYIAEGRVNGKTRRVTIGRHGILTADQARRLAQAALAGMAAGIDPTEARHDRKAQAVTLREVAEDYKENRRTRAGLPLKDSTKADIDKHLRASFSDWAERPVVGITRDMVIKRYRVRAERSAAQANQAMRILSALINYAAAKYQGADGGPIMGANPVQVLRDAQMLRAVKPRSVSVPLDQIGAWWHALTQLRTCPALSRTSRTAADCIALIALTGLRVGEARAIRRDQVSLAGQALKLTDTKNRSDVRLPLSVPAVRVLRGRPEGEYVFPARSGRGHIKSIRDQLEALAERSRVRVTAHDLRRTFVQVGIKALGIELWRVKLLANHKVPKNDVTLAAYGDLADRRFLQTEADRIGEYFEQQRLIHESGNVVDIRQKA